jgi:hypothetical protein
MSRKNLGQKSDQLLASRVAQAGIQPSMPLILKYLLILKRIVRWRQSKTASLFRN